MRSRALARIAGQGGMIAVGLSPERFAERAAGFGDRVGIAAVNGPASLIVSADPEALEELLGGCQADGVQARRIASTVAGHSPQIEPLREQMLSDLVSVSPRASELPLYSTVTPGLLDTTVMDAEHWYRNLRQSVLFAPAVEGLLGDGRRTFVEVGPHPVLGVAVEGVAERVLGGPGGVVALGTLRRDQGGLERFVSSLAELYVRGGGVDWGVVFEGVGAGRVRLPTYAFQRERFWVDVVPEAIRDPSPAVVVGSGDEVVAGSGAGSSFAGRLVGMVEGERAGVVLDAMLGQVAVVLGHGSGADVDARLSFKELGLTRRRWWSCVIASTRLTGSSAGEYGSV